MLVTPEQAAQALSVGRTTLYGLLAAGVLASVQIGRCRRIPYDSVRAYVQHLQAKPSEAALSMSRRSAKMRGRHAEAGPLGPANVTVEALRLPLAAEDQAADEVQELGREV